jgi:hypothetical protein
MGTFTGRLLLSAIPDILRNRFDHDSEDMVFKTAHHLRISTIAIAYCKFAEALNTIRQITEN